MPTAAAPAVGGAAGEFAIGVEVAALALVPVSVPAKTGSMFGALPVGAVVPVAVTARLPAL